MLWFVYPMNMVAHLKLRKLELVDLRQGMIAATNERYGFYSGYKKTIVPCFRCDFAMASGERDSLNLCFPYLLCYASVCCNISAMAGQNLMKSSMLLKILSYQ